MFSCVIHLIATWQHLIEQAKIWWTEAKINQQSDRFWKSNLNKYVYIYMYLIYIYIYKAWLLDARFLEIEDIMFFFHNLIDWFRIGILYLWNLEGFHKRNLTKKQGSSKTKILPKTKKIIVSILFFRT